LIQRKLKHFDVAFVFVPDIVDKDFSHNGTQDNA